MGPLHARARINFCRAPEEKAQNLAWHHQLQRDLTMAFMVSFIMLFGGKANTGAHQFHSGLA